MNDSLSLIGGTCRYHGVGAARGARGAEKSMRAVAAVVRSF